MSRSKRVRKARMAARQERQHTNAIRRAHAFLVEAQERARFRAELKASNLPDAAKTVLGFLADPIGYVADEAARVVVERRLCELCVEPIDKPHVDQYGTKTWNGCRNYATRQVLGDNGRPLNVCEEHFQKGSS